MISQYPPIVMGMFLIGLLVHSPSAHPYGHESNDAVATGH